MSKGKGSGCAICGSRWPWAASCPVGLEAKQAAEKAAVTLLQGTGGSSSHIFNGMVRKGQVL